MKIANDQFNSDDISKSAKERVTEKYFFVINIQNFF